MCTFIVLFVLRSANVANIIRNTDITWVLEETGVSDEIVDRLNELPFLDTELDISDVEEFIKNSAVSDEIGSIADGYIKAFAEGNLDHHLTSADVIGIARSLEPEFSDLFDYNVTEEQYEEIARALDDIVDFQELSVGNIMDEMDIDPAPYIFISSYLLWGVGVLCVVFLLIIYLRRWRNMPDALRAVGTPIALTGLISFAAGMWLGSFPGSPGNALYIASKFLGGPAHLIMQHGIAFIAVGVLIILTSFIVSAIFPKT